MVTDPAASAFRGLQRALLRRRVQRIEPRLRVEIAALALLVGAFLFWWFRIRFAGLAADRGPRGPALALVLLLCALAVAGGVAAGTGHVRLLRRGGGGPAWLALPVAPALLARHLAWRSRTAAFALPLPVLIAAPALLAAAGLAPLPWLLLLAGGFVALLIECGRAGSALAERLVALRLRVAGKPRIQALLLRGERSPMSRRAPEPRWRRPGATLAIAHKDVLLARRSRRVRTQWLATAAFAVASVMAWWLPGIGPSAHPLAFGLALMAAAAFGEWILVLGGEDPFAVTRSLPLGWRPLWAARMLWVGLAATALLGAHALAAHPLPAEARALFLSWLGAAFLAIGTLAVNYSVTLYPRAVHARRLYALSLAIAVAASVAIPLLGWIVLLAALAHSAARLPRWSSLEERS